MVRRCFVSGCTEYRKKNTSFHRFPTDSKIAVHWSLMLQGVNKQKNSFTYDKNSVVCGWHFAPHNKILVGRKCLLKTSAIPTLFENYNENNVVFLDDNDMGNDLTPLIPDSKSDDKESNENNPNYLNCETGFVIDTPSNTKASSTIPNSSSNPSSGYCNYGFLDSEILHGHDDPDDVCIPNQNDQHLNQILNDEIFTSVIDTPSTQKRAVKRKHDSSLSKSGEKPKLFRYFGDIDSKKLTPENKDSALNVCIKAVQSARKKINVLHNKVWRKNKQIRTLKKLLATLKTKYKLSEQAVSHLEMSYGDEILVQLKNGKMSKEYSEDVKAFACTLNFYSSAAYEYIRQKFGKHLPSQSTIQKWYSSVDASAGISELAMHILTDRVKEKTSGEKVFVALMIDEMAIRISKFWNHSLKKWEGLVDFGCEFIKTGNDTPASHALVFLVNEINGHGKIPISHYFTHSITGDILCTLVTNALEKLHKTGVHVMSLTFDGPSYNIAMAHLLGGNVWNINDLRCSFKHPITKEPLFLFLDICHMLKLVRNVLATKGIIFDDNKEPIKWQYIVELEKLQSEEMLLAGTKLRKRHTHFQNEKMKVSLAAQTLSNSVADALEYCLKIKLPQFTGCEATIRFIRYINNLFDILNSRNLTCSGFKRGISETNSSNYFLFFSGVKDYIKKLTTNKKDLLVSSQSRTGFMGFLTAIESTRGIFDLYVTKRRELKFLLMYKFSQDHLETLFSVIRLKRGSDNNLTTRQFQAVFKRLLIRNEIKNFSRNSNSVDDKTPLFTTKKCVAAINENVIPNIETEFDDTVLAEFEHEFEEEEFLCTSLTEYIIDVVTYIAGFVERKLKRRIKCDACLDCLENGEMVHSDLIQIKDRGGLIYPQKSVFEICNIVEKLVRTYDVNDNKFYDKVRASCFRALLTKNVFDNMTNHILEQQVLDNHKTLVISAIIDLYCKVRMHHIGKVFNEKLKSNRVRSKNLKLTLFAGQ